MVSTIRALNAYSDQKEMVARKTSVEAWNSRFVRSILFMAWRETLRTHTLVSGSKEATDPASWIKRKPNRLIPPGDNGYEAILQVLQQARSTSFLEEEVNVLLMAMSS